jgi:hypothetical protein
MKRFYVLFAVIAMTAMLLAGCNGGNEQIPADGPDAEYSEDTEPEGDGSDSETGGIAMFDGTWWYRQEPTEGMSLDIFCFDGETVVFYDQNGNEIQRGAATDNGDGTFTMTLEMFGDVECRFGQTDGSWTIMTVEDEALFVSGDPIDSSVAAGDYTGKWYRNGSLDEDYLAVNEDGTYAICTAIGDETLAREEGKWELLDRSNGGKELAVDGSFSRSFFNVTVDGAAIWDSDGKYYVKESLIGSTEGDLACRTVSLYSADYWSPEDKQEGATYFEFHEDGTLTVMILQEDGYIEDRGDGSWEHRSEGAFALTLDDGTEHIFTVDEHVLTLDDGPGLRTVFNRFSYFG